MRVLVHLGLNKCGSTYLQHALHRARPFLAQAGVCYPYSGDPPCQYGVSKHYGFGPDVDDIAPKSVAACIEEARGQGCTSLILSSEYLSLYRPKAALAFHSDIAHAGADAHYLMFSRPIVPWIKSLFNQYVRTVESGRYLPNIDAYVDQVLANRTVDAAARHDLWASVAGAERLVHVQLDAGLERHRLMDPVSAFIGQDLPLPVEPDAATGNASLSVDALYRIGLLRRQPANASRDAALADLLCGGAPCGHAPADYAEIGATRQARLDREIIDRYDRLPMIELSDRLSLWHRLGAGGGPCADAQNQGRAAA